MRNRHVDKAFWPGVLLTLAGAASTANNLEQDKIEPTIDHVQSALAAVIGHDVRRPVIRPGDGIQLSQYGPNEVRNIRPCTKGDKRHAHWHAPDRQREIIAAKVNNLHLLGLGVTLTLIGSGKLRRGNVKHSRNRARYL